MLKIHQIESAELMGGGGGRPILWIINDTLFVLINNLRVFLRIINWR